MLMLPFQHEQYRQSKQAIAALQSCESAGNIRKQINAALRLTNMSERKYVGKPLFAFEPELFHTLARLYARENKPGTAITILQNVLASANKYPPDGKTYEKQVMPMLLTLAKLQEQTKNYNAAIDTLSNGFTIAAKRNNGTHCLSFLDAKISTLLAMGDKNACKPLFEKSKAGHALLATAQAAKPQKLDHSKVKHLGNLLALFINTADLTRKEVYSGICTSQEFTKLETNVRKTPNIFLAEALTQRMGRSVGNYYTLCTDKKDFDTWELRDKIQVLVRKRNYAQATKHIKELKALEATKRYQNKLVEQFALATEATIYGAKNKGNPSYMRKLKNALLITMPAFDENNIAASPLTIQEAELINQVAIYYEDAKQPERAADTYKILLRSIETHWLDETLKTTMYPTASFNYSSCLGRMGKREEAIAFIDSVLPWCIGRGALQRAFSLVFNKAYNMFMQEKKDEALPLFLTAYHGLTIFEEHGEAVSIKTIQDFMQKAYNMML